MKHAIIAALFLALFSSTAFAATWNGHEYSYIASSSYSFTWAQARADAQSNGWDLVSITSADEMNFIMNNVLADSIHALWIGGYQTENSASPSTGWNWASGEAWGYTNWSNGEPNDGLDYIENNDENYLMIYTYPNPSRFRWNDASGAYTLYGYVMERATPVPGAFWLLGSGLMGLVGLRKRMKT